MPKTITDIIPPSRRKALEAEGGEAPPSGMASMESFGTPPPPPRPTPTMSYDKPKGGFPWKLAAVAAVVVVASVGLMYAFSGAKVTITPTVSATAVAGDFVASPSAGELPFEIVTVEKIGRQSVPAEGTENANDPAQGSIVIYNQQAKVQELIKNTRFETPDGLIFRIHESVRVPAGTAERPGQLTVTAYADAGGEKYNIGPSTFTLPGLSGSAAFEQVYAKSDNPMQGGFSGVRPSVSQATKDAQSAKIQAALSAELAEEVRENLPEGYVLLPGATVTSFAQMPATAGNDSKSVNVEEKGTATAIVFPATALGKAIAYQTVGTYAGQEVRLETADTLTLAPKDGSVIAVGTDSFAFTLSGNARVIWTVDADKIAGSVAGKSRNAAQTILAGFPEVERAVLSLKPFWAGSLPEDPKEIKIEILTPRGN